MARSAQQSTSSNQAVMFSLYKRELASHAIHMYGQLPHGNWLGSASGSACIHPNLTQVIVALRSPSNTGGGKLRNRVPNRLFALDITAKFNHQPTAQVTKLPILNLIHRQWMSPISPTIIR